MQEISLIDRILKQKYVSAKTAELLTNLRTRGLRFGSFTDRQKELILKVAKENNINVEAKKNEPDKFEIKEFKSVLSDEERAEFWTYVKNASQGKYTKDQVEQIQKYMTDVLKDKGVEVEK